MSTTTDSRTATLLHIKRVNQLLLMCISRLLERAAVHDTSKLLAPERQLFDVATHSLAGLSYGTPEYKEALKTIEPALKHHYEHNSHHPEHYKDGVDGMDLFDVIEMLMDWKAAGERHLDGNIWKSIEINTKRFNLSPQLVNILMNTISRMSPEIHMSNPLPTE